MSEQISRRYARTVCKPAKKQFKHQPLALRVLQDSKTGADVVRTENCQDAGRQYSGCLVFLASVASGFGDAFSSFIGFVLTDCSTVSK